LIQRQLASAEEQEDLSAVRDIVGRGAGQPLEAALKDEMEAQFGQDFSAVRIHADGPAARSAADLSARAYTVGDEIVLGGESPALDSADGKRMLAHELTHVIQQRHGPVSGTPVGGGISISDPSDAFEQAAEQNASELTSASTAWQQPGAPTEGLEPALAGMALQRQEEEEEEEEETESPPGQAQAETTPEAGEAEQEVEMAEAGQAEAVEESAEDQASELEVEEDQVSQAEAQIANTEEEEEEEEEQVAV
jgi:hypothetical protein